MKDFNNLKQKNFSEPRDAIPLSRHDLKLTKQLHVSMCFEIDCSVWFKNYSAESKKKPLDIAVVFNSSKIGSFLSTKI